MIVKYRIAYRRPLRNLLCNIEYLAVRCAAGWGPSSFHPQADGSPAKGMGGSEEAVYYTSIELARMGYDVVVYSSVTSADHGSVHYYTADGPLTASVAMQWRGAGNGLQRDVGSVSWLHHNTYNPIPDTSGQQVDSRCEIFIAWRYTISLGLARQPRHFAGCGRKYLWLHDLIPGSILPPSFFLHFDGILVQSEFHKGFIRAAFAPHAATHAYVDMTQVASGIAVIPNGISQSHPMDGANNNAVFIYGSAPGRGLEHVLSQWGTIKKSIPDATLEVYYGFTETALKDLREKLGAGFVRWYEQMQAYLRQDGVKYFGTVDHETLTAAFTRAGTIAIAVNVFACFLFNLLLCVIHRANKQGSYCTPRPSKRLAASPRCAPWHAVPSP